MRLNTDHHEPLAGLRKLLPYTTAAVIIAALYVGWVFFSRWQDSRETQRKQVEAQQAEAQKVVEAYGGNRAKVLSFTATPGVVRRGETSQLCYGVSNAKSVNIEPPVGDVWPSMYRCLDVKPGKDTIYKITVTDAEGHTDKQSVLLRVQ